MRNSDGKYSQVARYVQINCLRGLWMSPYQIFQSSYYFYSRMALSHPNLPVEPTMKDTEKYVSHSGLYDTYHDNYHTRSHRNSRRGSGVMLRKDILYAGSLFNIPEYKYVSNINF